MFLPPWTCKANNIAVRVLQPNLVLSGCWNKMRFFDHFSPNFPSSFRGGIRVIDLKPNYDSMTMWLQTGIRQIWVVLIVPNYEAEGRVHRYKIVPSQRASAVAGRSAFMVECRLRLYQRSTGKTRSHWSLMFTSPVHFADSRVLALRLLSLQSLGWARAV